MFSMVLILIFTKSAGSFLNLKVSHKKEQLFENTTSRKEKKRFIWTKEHTFCQKEGPYGTKTFSVFVKLAIGDQLLVVRETIMISNACSGKIGV